MCTHHSLWRINNTKADCQFVYSCLAGGQQQQQGGAGAAGGYKPKAVRGGAGGAGAGGGGGGGAGAGYHPYSR